MEINCLYRKPDHQEVTTMPFGQGLGQKCLLFKISQFHARGSCWLGCLEVRMGALVILTAHSHTGTLWTWPRIPPLSKQGQLLLCIHKDSTASLAITFSSVYVDLPAFQCVPTASCPMLLGTIEKSLASSLLSQSGSYTHG